MTMAPTECRVPLFYSGRLTTPLTDTVDSYHEDVPIMKFAAALLLLLAPSGASACTVYWSTADAVVTKVIQTNGWDFANYETVCRKLQAANAELYVNGAATVLGGRSIGWASVGIKAKGVNVATFASGGTSTNVDDSPGTNIAETMLMQSINRAVGYMDVDAAIRHLDEAKETARAQLGREPGGT